MRKIVLLMLLCLALAGCSREPIEVPTTEGISTEIPTEVTCLPVDYSLNYRDTYLTIEDSEAFFQWYLQAAGATAELPVLILESQADADTLTEALTQKHSQEAAAQLEAMLEETRQLFWVEELFEQWSVAMILCREENGAAQHIVQGTVMEDTYTLTIRRVCDEEDTQPKLRLIPVWIPKVRLVNYQAVEAVWGESITQRYLLSVTPSEDYCKCCITEGTWADSLEYEICYRDVTHVQIDFAGETMELQAALESGRITMEDLLLRAQIDADSGACRRDDYNDGGTIAYSYETYRLFKLKKGGIPGDIWITAPDVKMW